MIDNLDKKFTAAAPALKFVPPSVTELMFALLATIKQHEERVRALEEKTK